MQLSNLANKMKFIIEKVETTAKKKNLQISAALQPQLLNKGKIQ